ncbi:glucuronate isomerase [Cellulomonas hominis]|uniref:Uronate isomerase n=1 Tax=Cellulomonas hominis TaxID=156981 RepID=A0A511FGD2_9CELL|nr:glucuronate isomerase [Cellulomonas hominis]MBB5475479.1 glucuronate isomerase [Cellulomonas hominis]MBU5421228.1 glucuronate isomerase [Cellulomonas hominis]NKY07692.1 glucuronate isomerase [Cellulomonas hominis]GEL48306.1 uronate isomerase [Cellulomonas hominis]
MSEPQHARAAACTRDADRLLPTDPQTRAIARDLYARVADAPIISPHGHVPASLLAKDEPFGDPAELFVVHDHYVTRLLHAAGLPLSDLGLGARAVEPREVWRRLAERWHLFAGTASGYWLDEELSTVLGIRTPLTPATADAVYDAVQARLLEPGMTPRSLFSAFRVAVLATTDDPLDDLADHRLLQGAGLRVLPTFRPDAYLDPDGRDFVERVERLLSATGSPQTFTGYLDALAARRAHFVANGAVSADHGVLEPVAADLDAAEAERLFGSVLAGTADARQRATFRAHMLLQMARMSVEDGLVMTVHAGVRRNHSTATLRSFGPDTGHDIPVPTSYTDGLRPLLERFGLDERLSLILFTVDETTFSRELAPLAGFYPSVRAGAPWWFLDAPHAMDRYRAAVTETAGFYRTSGFVDDTRAFLSIPVRHDTARRADAGYLARLVREGRLTLPGAERIADDLVDAIPRAAFRL